MFGLLQSGRAYSLGGPIGNNPNPAGLQPGGDSWQQAVIGYGLPGDLNAPKNLGEEYRRNTPVMYYAFDANFLDFFGTNGEAAVGAAFAIMNNLTNVSSYSANLVEFPLETRHMNYQAQALGLYDLKSFTLGALMEQMGLADPVRYAWTLHDRFNDGVLPCPEGEEYQVVQRNFDFISSPLNQLQYSPYVNNTLYSYAILEECTGPDPLALAVPLTVDPTADTYSPVASAYGGFIAVSTSEGLLLDVAPGIYSYGSFYTGLTRDDVAGLRYLLQPSTINTETAALGSVLTTAITNTSPQLFPVALTNNGVLVGGIYYGTYDLGALLSSSRTNPPTTLEALFPGVIIATSTNYFAIVTNYNVVDYFTNYIGSAAGSAPVLVVVTNASVGIGEFYVDTFANIVTNHYYPNTVETLQTVTVGPRTGSPAGSPAVTNTSSATIILTNVPSGDYYILPTNTCGLDIINTNFFSTVVTNITASVFGTNAPTATNTTGTVSSSSQTVIYTTNYVFEILPVTCTQTTGATGLYEGVNDIQFVYSSYDSLVGQYYQPITNNYTMVVVTNSQARVQTFQRIVTVPDFLFSADDLATGPGSTTHTVYEFFRNLNFDQANVLPGLAGPGTINPSTTIGFNKSGPVYYNSFGDVLDGTPYFSETPGGDTSDLFYDAPYFVWGSFDGTTNAPVVYPSGTGINDLLNQILIQISPATVPGGVNGTVYSPITFTTTGGSLTPPYNWSATGLPGGLSVSAGGTLSGTPTQSGTFVFTLTMTDYLSRTVQWNYPLTIQ